MCLLFSRLLDLAYIRYSFTCFVCVQESIIPLLPSPICITHTTAIQLRDLCAIHDLPPTLPLYATFICHTPYNIGNNNIVYRLITRRSPYAAANSRRGRKDKRRLRQLCEILLDVRVVFVLVGGVRLGAWGVVLVVCVFRCRGCCSLSVCV